jgi:hypothetical protein
MQRIPARKLLEHQPAALWDLLTGVFEIVFDDGSVIETTAEETIFTRYCWRFFDHQPSVPILPSHHMTTLLSKQHFTGRSHLDLLEIIWWDVTKHFNEDPALRAPLRTLISDIANEYYNDVSVKTKRCMLTIDFHSYMQIIEHPPIDAAKEAAVPTEMSVVATNEFVANEVMNSPVFNNNGLAVALRAKAIKRDQFIKCVSLCGYVIDLTTDKFPNPIMTNYVEGLRLFHDSLIESRTATISLEYAKGPLRDAEYFSRRIQLVCKTLQRLHKGDCGTTEYLPWIPKSIKEIETYAGSYEVLEDGTLREVMPNDVHLIGKFVRLRNVIYCKHSDPNGVCTTCFGTLHHSVPDDANLGSVASTFYAQLQSQDVLSLKHSVASAVMSAMYLTDDQLQFFNINYDNTGLTLSAAMKRKKTVYLVVPNHLSKDLNYLNEVSDVTSLPTNRYGSFGSIDLFIEEHNGDTEETTIPLRTQDSREATFSYEMLEYMKTHGWCRNDKGAVTINITNFDLKVDMFTYPQQQFDVLKYIKINKEFLEGSAKQVKTRAKEMTPEAFLTQFYELLSKRYHIPIALISCITLAFMARSVEDRDYRLPKNAANRVIGVKKNLLEGRSASAMMAFQGHDAYLTDPAVYIQQTVPDHPMDAILMPAEYAIHNKR